MLVYQRVYANSVGTKVRLELTRTYLNSLYTFDESTSGTSAGNHHVVTPNRDDPLNV